MKRSTMRSVALIVGGLLAFSGTACGGGVDPSASDPSDRLTIKVPPVIGGLTVKESPKATKKYLDESKTRSTYVKGAQIFELRQGKELQAVLQIVRLTADARPEDPEFRKKIADGISGSARAPERLGGQLVYRATSNNQIVTTWFQSKFMQVLIVRQDSVTLAQQGSIDINSVLTDVLALKPTPV